MARIPKNKITKEVQGPRVLCITREISPDGTVLFKRKGSSCSNVVRFPQKLWNIVHSCDSGAIGWTADGECIFINYTLFRNEYLVEQPQNMSSSPIIDIDNFTCSQSITTSSSQNQSTSNIFKTSQITSFIRQLNLYGFRKVLSLSGAEEILDSGYLNEDFAESFLQSTTETNPEIQVFANQFFRRGRHDLIKNVVRCANPSEHRVRIIKPKKCKKSRKEFKLIGGHRNYESRTSTVHQKNSPRSDDDFIGALISTSSPYSGNKLYSDGRKVVSTASTVLSPVSDHKCLTPTKSIIRQSLEYLTVDGCLRLLDFNSSLSWASFNSECQRICVRNLSLHQLMDSTVPPIASVMRTSCDPFLSSPLFSELR